MTTTDLHDGAFPAVYAEFGQALGYTERTLTTMLREHLAPRGIEPETWYALKLTASGGRGFSRDDLCHELAGSPKLDEPSSRVLVSDLEAQGLIEGDETVTLTALGTARFRELRAFILGPTIRLLDQLELDDVVTTVRTLQAITEHALAMPESTV